MSRAFGTGLCGHRKKNNKITTQIASELQEERGVRVVKTSVTAKSPHKLKSNHKYTGDNRVAKKGAAGNLFRDLCI